MKHSPIIRTGVVAALCALVGALAGIAGSAAAPSHKPRAHMSQAESSQDEGPQRGEGGGFAVAVRVGKLGAPGGPPVHSELVVPNKAGDGFDTITSDRGSFQSLSGDQLTITEGTKSATYKTVTLTIPADATVYRNGTQAQLSDIQSGDEVMVLQGPKGTVVTAADAQHQNEHLMIGGGPGPMTKMAPSDGTPVPAPAPPAEE